MTWEQGKNMKQHYGPGSGGYKDMDIAPTPGSLSCGQIFNINKALMYKLQYITFPTFWNISLARFPEVGLLSQSVRTP